MTKTPEKQIAIQIKTYLDLDNPEDKAKILELGKKLKEYQSMKRTNPVEFYGHPLKDKYAEYVTNPLISSSGFGTHWSVIQYCLDNGIIKKRGDNHLTAWSIGNDGTKKSPVLINYADFMMRWKGLGVLYSRRKFAEKQEEQVTFEAPQEMFKFEY